jgi:two-component system response regulator TctD
MRTNANILIVDDEETTLLAMSEYFSDRGFTVDVSRSFGEAELFLSAHDYSALITDLDLAGPHENQGLYLVSRARGQGPDICIVLLTGRESPDVEAKARRLGADAFFFKPKSMPDLAQAVSDVIRSRRRNGQKSSAT